MSDRYLEYPLHDGYVHNWLVAGPQELSIPAPGEDTDRAEIARRFYRRISEIHEQPVELGTFQSGDAELTWRYSKCSDDHYVDLSAFYPTWHYLKSWAYAQVVSPADQDATLILTANGPVDVWLNREHMHRQEGSRSPETQRSSLQGVLHEGVNELLVRFEMAAVRATPYAMALQLVGLPGGQLTVRVPTWHGNIPRRHKLERIYQQAHLEQNVVLRGTNPVLRWDDKIDETGHVDFWLQDAREHILTAGMWATEPGGRIEVGGIQLMVEEGPHRIVLLPPAAVIERHDIRYQEYLPFRILATPYAEVPYGTYEDRRQELLLHAADRYTGLYADIARFALGRWPERGSYALEDALARVRRRVGGSVEDLIGLLGLVYRYLDRPYFTSRQRQSVEECVLGYRYWRDEPGADAMSYEGESRALLFHTCEILAGQRFPDRIFPNTGCSGQWHREKGERLALDWLHARGTTGFAEWDSQPAFGRTVLALAHLHDLAEDVQVRELAAVLLDKLFFSMAINSFRGVFGSTHGQTEAPMVKSGQLEATSGIGRLMWGMGVWNEHIRGPVALACSGYELPPTVPLIAADASAIWHLEQQAGVDKVTYRTADYMLCSAQDHRPGQRGCREHVWQATLGPDAVVFVNHPTCAAESSARRPNFWRGNGVLPRVAQWKDVLISIHSLPDESWLDWTHAYFPVHAFDEHVIDGDWAFARKGDGYLALAAAEGLGLVTRGPNAYRELRSRGQSNVWVCHMGRTADHSSFANFQAKVRALEIQFEGLSATCETLNGQMLSFGWEGPFVVGSHSQPLSGFRHYDGPFCSVDLGAEQMDINYGGYTLQLDFGLADE